MRIRASLPAQTPHCCHILTVFPRFAVGGAQTRYAALANGFGKAARHTIISLNGERGAAQKIAAGIVLEFAPAPPRAAMPLAIARAVRAIRRINPDIVLTSNWGAIEWAIAARIAGVRHVHSEDGFGPEERETQIARRVWLRRLALRGARLVVPSRKLQTLARQVWRLDARDCVYIPNGIDLARFGLATPAKLPWSGGCVIGTIAALRAEKNLGRLLKAFALVRQGLAAKLVIVGDGPDRGRLEEQARALGITDEVLFAGYSAMPEAWHRAFDVFALSSDTEQMPLGVLEAMAAGKPVVSTDVGDVRDMVSEENKGLVTALTVPALAAALREMLVDPERAARIGASNRARAVTEYDERKMIEVWSEILRIPRS